MQSKFSNFFNYLIIFLISHSCVAFIMVKYYLVKTHGLKFTDWWVLPKNSTQLFQYITWNVQGRNKIQLNISVTGAEFWQLFFPCIWYLMELYKNIVKLQRHVIIVFLSQFTWSNVCCVFFVHRTVIFPYYSTTDLPITWKFHK